MNKTTNNIGQYINKRRIRSIALVSVALLLVLSLFIGYTIHSVKEQATKTCFEELKVAANQLANELNMVIRSDHTTLSAIGAIIAGQDELSDDQLCKILDSYGFEETYLSHLTVLKPDNTMLYADGTVEDVSKNTDFKEAVKKGNCISGIHHSKRDPSEKIISHAVPVIKNGEVVCILYGIVELNDLAKRYKTSLYGGHAYVYLEDGDTGDLILDTWHKTQGNINDLGKREMLPGYSLDQAIVDMSKGVDGEIAFVSQSTGNVLYMRYEPVGINNWNVMITVEEKYALAHSEAITRSLYQMAILCGIALLLYFAFIVYIMMNAYKQVKRIGTIDQNTGLQNRNAYDEYVQNKQKQLYPIITCAYIDANGLHTLNNERGHAEGDRMLRAIADALREEFDEKSIFRIGGDEFVVFSEADSEAMCQEKMTRISNELEAREYSVSSGVISFIDETGLGRITKEADALMLKNKREYYAKHDRRRK